ncbi:YagK/YfjJ domain-containing protein [Colwellia hornerae]|uniref:Inovirus Gp2 family protein n=1 Tax=Colwellia hornerae TaxID=89402 RepID=A0A5C6QFX9_9GAMM|nr:inovirus-type Gp2 protein [Colwellia hornerae]TWX55255.1 inovirus Gp2 family protein [Colwellia hornerae]TWX61255.1 inovirus Gp2 family protein [Colwellia hornerae]TWX67698.1 inovirus Gp2 family protein [Colwellia hornerae]
MKKVTKSQTITMDGIELDINTKDYSGCYINILQIFKNKIDTMLTYHCKVFTYRFDLHLKSATDYSEGVSKFIKKLRKKLRSIWDLEKMGYIWAREQHDAEAQHYHFCLMLDGNKIQNSKNLRKTLMEIATQMEMTLGYCERPTEMLNRTNLITYKALFKRLSYLAKERGKEVGKRKKTANNYSSNRIKPNPKSIWRGHKDDFVKLHKLSEG